MLGSGSTSVPHRFGYGSDEEYDENGYRVMGYTYVDPSAYKKPDEEPPMCYCGDPCKLGVSGLYPTLMQRYWNCSNFAYDPTPDDEVLIVYYVM
jgi:hypothetical protein